MTPTVEAAPTPAPAGTPPADASERLRYAKDVIAGRILPADEPTPPAVETVLRRMLPPGRSASRGLRDDIALQYRHGGKVVVTCDLPDGRRIVLARGDETGELVRALTPAEKARIVIRFPEPWAGESLQAEA